MARQSVFDMKVSKVYPLLVRKAERKGRSKDAVFDGILYDGSIVNMGLKNEDNTV